MSRKVEGVGLAADHAKRALTRATQAASQSHERLGAVIEAAWWLSAGWESAGKPSEEADAVLQGFWWIRNRTLHDIGMLVRSYGSYADGYGGSPPAVTKTADVYTDVHESTYGMTEIWGSSDEIRPTLTEPDKSSPADREKYDSHLAGRPILGTISDAIARLNDMKDGLG